jgi:hypothetical protein
MCKLSVPNFCPPSCFAANVYIKFAVRGRSIHHAVKLSSLTICHAFSYESLSQQHAKQVAIKLPINFCTMWQKVDMLSPKNRSHDLVCWGLSWRISVVRDRFWRHSMRTSYILEWSNAPTCRSQDSVAAGMHILPLPIVADFSRTQKQAVLYDRMLTSSEPTFRALFLENKFS